MKIISNPPDPGRMTGAEMRVVREGLGLSGPQLALVMGVNDRTVRRWELGETPIPESVRVEIEGYERSTAEQVAAVVADVMAVRGDAGLVTYPSDEEFWRAEPHMWPWPASWQRVMVYRVAQEVPGLEILYETDVSR